MKVVFRREKKKIKKEKEKDQERSMYLRKRIDQRNLNPVSKKKSKEEEI